jgi:Ca-activated chloride channel family protein
MNFLNPWAFLMIAITLWIFKNLIGSKTQNRVLLVVLILTLFALSHPVITNELSKEKFIAHEYILAIDVSYSMMAKDIKPNRYKIAKQNIIKLLKNNTKDMFSIFAFTSNPLLISPPTTDHNIAISALDALTPEYILTKGTSLLELLKTIAKLQQKNKSLILFSDGGDEKNIDALLHTASTNNITINIVATASQRGSILEKNNHNIKDKNGHLVVSRINPILKDLAYKTGGFYIKLDEKNKDITTQIQTKLTKQKLDAQKLDADIISYTELYPIPLFFAFILLLLSLTKFEKYIPFLIIYLIFYPDLKIYASTFDFYHNKVAKEAYKNKNFTLAIEEFKKLSPSKYSYISIANSYYKNKEYKNALFYYSKIKTKDKKIKSIVLYNMANSAVMLKKYNRAKKLYKNSLILYYSKEAYENLINIIKIMPKIDVADMLPHIDDKKVKNITKNNQTKKDDKQNSSKSNSKKNTTNASNGAGGDKKVKNKNISLNKNDKNRYKMGYNAYELINKGYIDEKRPW